MKRSRLDADHLSRRVSGKSVSHVTLPDNGRLTIHFTDGSILLVERCRQGVGATLTSGEPVDGGLAQRVQPTRRQLEYLDFITKYFLRFGISPAESDIQRRFLVSAPSVNQMVQRLERRGFIIRQRGVPRSIRVVDQALVRSSAGTPTRSSKRKD